MQSRNGSADVLDGVQIHREAGDGPRSLAGRSGTDGVGVLHLADTLEQGATKMLQKNSILIAVSQVSRSDGMEYRVAVVDVLEFDLGIGAAASGLNHGGVEDDHADGFDVAEIKTEVLGSGLEFGLRVKEKTFAISVISPGSHDKTPKVGE